MNALPFSVVMSVYYNDNPMAFDRALESITTNQSIEPDEIIIVCDGLLKKELDDILEKYRKAYLYIKVIKLPSNQGLGNALKIAVENASNELIARMDSDDVSASDRFEQQINYYLEHPETDVLGGDITEFVDIESNIIGTRKVPTTNNSIKEFMKKRCAMNHVSVMFKKQSVMNAGGYLDWFWNEDYYLWIRMQLNNAVFANTGTVLVNVRVGKEMYQRRGGLRYFLSEYRLQKLMLDNNMISTFTFVCNVMKRIIVQLLLPNTIRGWVFKTFARE